MNSYNDETYYDQASSDEDISSYMDAYATSSSSFKPALATRGANQQPLGGNQDSATTRTALNNQGAVNWQQQDSRQWAAEPSQSQPSLGVGNNFDLATGNSQFVADLSEKTRERNVLAANQLASSKPRVPSSTTTAAPEYVMINPTGSDSSTPTQAGSSDTSDQDE